MRCSLEVLAPGPLTTIQDLGRPGYAHWGVPWSGAADRASARLANRLVGNPEGAACLEVTLGGLRLRVDADVLVATTGAPCPVTAGERTVGDHAVVTVRAGEELTLGPPDRGLRTYLAVRGGIDVPPVLGSRATDVLGGVGPAPLAAGHRLPVGALTVTHPPVDRAPVPAPAAGEVELRVRLGPRADWFTRAAGEALLAGAWVARPDSNRIALRLTGPELERQVLQELPSEGVVRGSLQVPPSGSPSIFLADHPVTGGYPVIAVVLDEDVDRAAQVRPGQRIRLRAVRADGVATRASLP
jgi:biotin-dependent carboxylase-like uncharacterized protein